MTPLFESILRRHLRHLTDGQQLNADDSLAALGLDSMQSMELLFDLEDGYQITLPDEEVNGETFSTPRSLHRAVLAAGGVDRDPLPS